MSSFDNREEWDELFDFGKTIELIDKDLEIAYSYVALKTVWPLVPRDMVVAGRTIREPNGSIWLISTSVDHPSYPPSINGDFVRCIIHFSGTAIIPLTSDSCKVVTSSASNPGGSIPQWASNAAALKSPLIIAAVRDYLRKNPKKVLEVRDLFILYFHF